MVSIGSDLSTRFLELSEELSHQSSEPHVSAQLRPELSLFCAEVEETRYSALPLTSRSRNVLFQKTFLCLLPTTRNPPEASSFR